jgi:hypothetical protein
MYDLSYTILILACTLLVVELMDWCLHAEPHIFCAFY